MVILRKTRQPENPRKGPKMKAVGPPWEERENSSYKNRDLLPDIKGKRPRTFILVGIWEKHRQFQGMSVT